MSTFEAYSKYYNLLYKDKEYAQEVHYLESLFNQLDLPVQSILDLGCGTGRHDAELLKKGYLIQGVDLSKDMLLEAKKFSVEGRLSFAQGDIRTYRDNKIYDAVISLFHVMSYQTQNEDVISTIQTAYAHLKPGGIFVFDFWYGPAVLHQLPQVRYKELEDEQIKVMRIAEPKMWENENVIDVNYKIIIQEKATQNLQMLTETHRMRYFFMPEIKHYMEICGFEDIRFYEFLTQKEPSKDTWGVCCVGVKS